jgi:carbon-monoxide dehydrogenase medium subunit
MTGYDYFKPKTLVEAFGLRVKYPDSRFIAGGTDVMVRIKHRQLNPEALISLRSIAGLDKIEIGRVTRIGSMTTIADLLGHLGLAERFPALARAARELGSVQIRNVATVGGNLCNASPCADTALPLLVYDARVELSRRDGAREVPLDKFFVGPGATCMQPGEIMTAILIDTPSSKSRASFQKKGRVKMDIAVASLAFRAELDGDTVKKPRVAAGSVAPVPLRLGSVEKILDGQKMDPELISKAEEAARNEVAPISDVRASADYRRHLIGVYLGRALRDLKTGTGK